MKKGISLLLTLMAAAPSFAQYAPQAMVTGSTAISKNSTVFVGWASSCQVQRGLQQIDDPSFGLASLGNLNSALGFPDGDVLSLGDSGVAVVRFAQPLEDGPGADFAVFENGFPNVADPEEAFLELAFVEVSSDGVNYTRFPAHSLTQDTTQLSSTVAPSYINARQIHNLAGKYIGSYGTPFDLAELAGTPGLDLNSITHIRFVDVIGTIGAKASHDVDGHQINDPFPTPFPGSGFDLDAVGAIHMKTTSVRNQYAGAIRLYPNPAGERFFIDLPQSEKSAVAVLHDPQGRTIVRKDLHDGRNELSLIGVAPGMYFLSVFKNGLLISVNTISHFTP